MIHHHHSSDWILLTTKWNAMQAGLWKYSTYNWEHLNIDIDVVNEEEIFECVITTH